VHDGVRAVALDPPVDRGVADPQVVVLTPGSRRGRDQREGRVRGGADLAVVVGRGASLYPEILPPTAGGPVDPDPAVLARLALLRSARGDALPTEPLYLRRPDVMPPAERKRALG